MAKAYTPSPEWLVRSSLPKMENDAGQLIRIDYNFEKPNGMLSAINNAREEDKTSWGRTVFGIQCAWNGLKKFCTVCPEQSKSLANLKGAFDAIRDRLTSTNTEPSGGNPLVVAADALYSLMTKMSEANLIGWNGATWQKTQAPQFDPAIA